MSVVILVTQRREKPDWGVSQDWNKQTKEIFPRAVRSSAADLAAAGSCKAQRYAGVQKGSGEWTRRAVAVKSNQAE